MSSELTAENRKHRKEWVLGNEEDACTLWTLGQWTPAFLEHFKELTGGMEFHAFEFRKRRMRWFAPKESSEKISKDLVRKTVERPEGLHEVKEELVRRSDAVYEFSRKVEATNVEKLTDEQLVAVFERHTELLARTISVGMLSTLMDFPKPEFTNYLEAFIAKKAKEAGAKKQPAEYFAALTHVADDNVQRKELRAFLELAKKVKQNRAVASEFKRNAADGLKELEKHPQLSALVESHASEFAWAYYGYVGPSLTREKIAQELHAVMAEEKDVEAHALRMDGEKKEAEEGIIEAEKELQLSAHEKQLFRAARDTVYMKIYRRDATSNSFYAMRHAVNEFARRMGISREEAEFVAPGEHRKLLLEKDRELKGRLKARTECCVFSAAGKEPVVLEGEKARAFIASIHEEEGISGISELRGKCACVGTASGRAKIINTPQEMAKMEKGDVLVSAATTPDIVQAMRKAAAIVTDIGGITSHAAIVSRELGVPCVIGTKNATKWLKDGELVEVDATNGIVRKL